MDSQLYQIDNSLLLDNSNDALNMVNAISVLTAHPACRTIKIATGYWDIPGTSLVLKTLEQFLHKEGTKVQLLIGADPVARVNQLKIHFIRMPNFLRITSSGIFTNWR